MGFARALLLGFGILTVFYVLISLYARSLVRERLEKQLQAEHPGLGGAERNAYIEAGMATYRRSLRRKLILGVYVVPLLAVAAIAYFINRQ
ncbi:hypothetical protein U879_18505 [Defluviimonas sp. 20V17]|uniref:Cation/multidrug efflux pump n=1 Tax=Allgaiera indica TaxID=765699 RepID=A0AAN4UN85_9RHOB|nr:hypothetical protein [Allgaiera indica]KDB02182.1 hypothetical protein U879_18505 [Defluviimonas sp. 20V17]GHD98801.1 hypothetical protein GCM10008024_03770 [Allgaiera indica]SDW05901.1 hypothetical protein SAMN05444006_101172 [Allgaiera indica]